MNLKLDFTKIRTIEFGVGCDTEEGDTTFSTVPVDRDVKLTLVEMATETWNKMAAISNQPLQYQASEKYGSSEHLYLPLENSLATALRQLHEAANLESDTGALADPNSIFSYFARFVDERGHRMTGVRRATQFKGVVKKRLIRVLDDTLKLVHDDVFKLDVDFDVLTDDDRVHVYRPAGFEALGGLQAAILGAVRDNVAKIATDLPYISFGSIETYAAKHPRAARYLASIRTQSKNVDRAALQRLCKLNGVECRFSNGKLIVAAGNELDFLEVLDRRRYEIELVKGSPERFRAPSRQRLKS